MRKIGLVLTGLFYSGTASAAPGLKSFVDAAGPEASGFVGGVLAILATGIIGLIGNALLSAFGGSKVAKLVVHGSYLAAVGIFFMMAIKLFNSFVVAVFG